MILKIRWLLILIVPFFLYHTNQLAGPDGDIYFEVAHNIATKGSLNILPESLTAETPYQITKTSHVPIQQNIGGVLFIIPATLLAVVSHTLAMNCANLPQRFYDILYHEGLWLGCVTYLLAMSTCFMMYRVARFHHGPLPAMSALLLSVFGGPLFLYTAVYPCNTNLPAAFLATSLLYAYYFADLKKGASWVLLGALLGLGIFVRYEFAIWSLLVVYGAFQIESSADGWQTVCKRICQAGSGCLLFIVPLFAIRLILFGQLGSPPSVQADLVNLSKAYLMLWGTRNGLFVFWPILLVALSGYMFKPLKNPPLYHVMFLMCCSLVFVCGTILFLNGGLGHSYGQRWIMVVFPCFVLYLARLFDLLERHYKLLLTAGMLCVFWALLLWVAYGVSWPMTNELSGFLVPLHLPRMVHLLATYYPLFFKYIALTLFAPKHIDVIWLSPMMAGGIFLFGRCMNLIEASKRSEFCLAVIILVSLVTTVFLSGAHDRGERNYQEIVAHNKQAKFVIRNQEINFETISSMTDCIAFYMELGDQPRTLYFKQKTIEYLKKEAPDQLGNFEQSIAALELRKSLGWYRLFPEQIHFPLLEWYRSSVAAVQQNRRPVDITAMYLF